MNKATSNNIVRHHASVTRACRGQLNGHRSVLLRVAGLSGSGKFPLVPATRCKLSAQVIRPDWMG